MDKLISVQRGIDLIEERLSQLQDLREVSRAAGMSHYSFQRTFKALTGATVMQYVRGRRLDTALKLLEQTDLRVLDVALEAGYGSQEAFARAFKRAYGITPLEFRAEGRQTRILSVPALDPEGLEHRAHHLNLLPTVSERSAMRLVGMLTPYEGASGQRNTLGPDLTSLWRDFLPLVASVPDVVAGPYYGLIRASTDGEHLEYIASVHVTGQRVPDGMVSVDLPVRRWATFTHRGLPARIDETVDYIYGTWLLHSRHHHPGSPDLEIYGEHWDPTSVDSVMHYAVPLD